MGSLLKALGVTIWGTIAVGLLLTIVLLGYRAVVKYRDLSAARSATGNLDVALGEIYYGLGDYERNCRHSARFGKRASEAPG